MRQMKKKIQNLKRIFIQRKVYIKNFHPMNNILMTKFHEAEWSDRSKIIQNFKDERLKYFGQKVLYQENQISFKRFIY